MGVDPDWTRSPLARPLCSVLFLFFGAVLFLRLALAGGDDVGGFEHVSVIHVASGTGFGTGSVMDAEGELLDGLSEPHS